MKARIPSPLRLLWVWSLLGMALFLGPYMFFFAPDASWHDPQGYLLGRDFVNVWFGAKQALSDKVSRIFVVHDYLADMRALLGEHYPRHNFSYPPHILPLIIIFGIAPYFPSFCLWSIGGMASFLAAVKANPFCRIGRPGLVLAALSPAAVFNLIFGQNGAFTAAFLLGGLYLCEASPVPAGILLGLLTTKPHLGVLVPLVLLMRRNWKCIFSAGVTMVALVALSLLQFGVTPWHDYVADTMPYQVEFLNGPYRIYNPLMPGPWSDAIRLFPGQDWSYILYGLSALAAFIVTILTVKREGMTARSVLVVALSTLIVLPYAFNYDMVAVAGALFVYLGTLPEIGIAAYVALGLLWALPAALIEFKLVPFPISSVILLSSLICLHFSRAGEKSGTRSEDSCNHPSRPADRPAAEG